MSSGILLIVGLGNPGAEYETTRHNAGAWFVTELARLANITLRHTAKFHGHHGVAHLHGHDCHLLIPSTFMNRSGLAVQAIANYYKIPPAAILVAHDEMDLPAGIIRLKLDGGHGGHNGLRDIFQQINSKQFYRLRIGVGHPEHKNAVVNYVLTPPKKMERQQIDTALDAVQSVLPLIMDGHIQKAMHILHSE